MVPASFSRLHKIEFHRPNAILRSLGPTVAYLLRGLLMAHTEVELCFVKIRFNLFSCLFRNQRLRQNNFLASGSSMEGRHGSASVATIVAKA